MSRCSPVASDVRRSRPLAAFLALVAYLAIGAPLRAQVAPVESIGSRIDASTRTRIHVDEPGDGLIWVRGATYKASFGVGGASYIPFFGSHAPKNHPIEFSIWSVTAGDEPIPFDRRAVPYIEGDSVLFHRGTFIERWHLLPDGVEQTFVFDNTSRQGELAVELIAFTDLEMSEDDDVIRFGNELGHVEYSRAVALDMEGRTCTVATQTEGARIRLAVPATFVESAQTPITIDPVISTFAVATSAPDHWLPDVSYDATTTHWIAVHEEFFSVADCDIFVELVSAGGVPLGGAYADSTATNWRFPHVANNNASDQFLVVSSVGDPAGNARIIRGRTVAAGNHAMGAQFTISGIDQGDLHQPDVGGDPAPIGPSYYCVVWTRDITFNGDIHYRLISPDGSSPQFAPGNLDDVSGMDDSEPSVSKSNGNPPTATQSWNLTWMRSHSALNRDVMGARIRRDGSIASPAFEIDASPEVDFGTEASSPQDDVGGVRRWVAVWCRNTPGGQDVMGRVLDGASVGPLQSLSSLEGLHGSGTQPLDQDKPMIECDGTRFVLGYTETDASGDEDAFVTTLTLVGASTLQATEVHRILGASNSNESYVALAAKHSSSSAPSARFMAVWARGIIGTFDVLGALYDAPIFHSFCIPDIDAGACPCGNPPSGPRGCNNPANTGGALLAAAGVPSLSADSVQMTTSGELPSAPSLLVQGSATANAVFGQGRRCSAGTLIRMYTKTASGGSISVPGSADPSFSARSAIAGHPLSAGTTRNYFVYYRSATVLGACAPTSTFNTSQAIQITWWP